MCVFLKHTVVHFHFVRYNLRIRRHNGRFHTRDGYPSVTDNPSSKSVKIDGTTDG